MFTTKESQKGRKETREYKVYDLEENKLAKGWLGLGITQVIIVKRIVSTSKGSCVSGSIYISSMKARAKEYEEGIRGHWGIENNLHRQKDVNQNEDQNLVKDGQLATNISILQTQVLNLFRMGGYKSIKGTNQMLANKPKKAYDLIINKLCI